MKKIILAAMATVILAGCDTDANEAEQFEADFALMSGELARMLGDLVTALGGERSGES